MMICEYTNIVNPAELRTSHRKPLGSAEPVGCAPSFKKPVEPTATDRCHSLCGIIATREVCMTGSMLGNLEPIARVTSTVIAVGLAVLSGCARPTQSPPQTVASVAPSVPPSHAQTLATTYVTSKDAATLTELFERATSLLIAGKYSEAAAAFDRVAQLEAAGSMAPSSLLNAGLCYESVGDRKNALARYQELSSRFPVDSQNRLALLRASRLLIQLEQWADLAPTAGKLLERDDLAPIERAEAFGSEALGFAENDDLQDATLAISRARSIIEDNHIDEASSVPVAIAPVYFALGEVRRLRAQKYVFVPVPPNFGEVLEQRCQMLLDAQDAYSQVMRTFDAHWAAMAGYRVGQLYQTLHDDVLAVPTPAAATTEKKKELFRGAMQLRYRVLLEKGLKMMQRVVAMAARTGEDSAWVNRTKEAKLQLERALREERDQLQKLPYSEAELQRALDSLTQSKAAGAQVSH